MTNKTSAMLAHLSTLRPGDRSEAHYEAWAADYEQDLIDNCGYSAHVIGADAFAAVCPDRGIRVLDVGCGTGLVGVELARHGFRDIDGLDISTEMLERAREKRVYRQLVVGDLTGRTSVADGDFDAAICVGSFAPGHLGPGCIAEILRMVKPGGAVVIFMNSAPYEAEDYAGHIRRLEEDGAWQVRGITTLNYMSALDRPGRLIIAHNSPLNSL